MAELIQCSKCNKVPLGSPQSYVDIYGCKEAGHYYLCNECSLFLAAWVKSYPPPLTPITLTHKQEFAAGAPSEADKEQQ